MVMRQVNLGGCQRSIMITADRPQRSRRCRHEGFGLRHERRANKETESTTEQATKDECLLEQQQQDARSLLLLLLLMLLLSMSLIAANNAKS